MNVPARREETWGSLGPAMRSLSETHREFVRAYIKNPLRSTGGGKVAAYRAAGLGEGSANDIQAENAWKLARDDPSGHCRGIKEGAAQWLAGGCRCSLFHHG